MYEELYSPLPDRQAYLDRIGFSNRNVCSAEDLDALVFGHLCSVPFDNLDVIGSQREPSILIGDLFDKIVTQKRGGYCYELNSLFSRLLLDLGFDVYVAMARIRWNKPEKTPYSHMAVIVQLDGKRWLCDVGYGGPAPRGILCLDEEAPQIIRGDRFRVLNDGTYAEVRRYENGLDLPMMEILLQPTDPVDFIPLNFHTALNPNSIFRQRPMISIHTPVGLKSFDGSVFREKIGKDTVREIPVHSSFDSQKILLEEFGIPL